MMEMKKMTTLRHKSEWQKLWFFKLKNDEWWKQIVDIFVIDLVTRNLNLCQICVIQMSLNMGI